MNKSFILLILFNFLLHNKYKMEFYSGLYIELLKRCNYIYFSVNYNLELYYEYDIDKFGV